jgi:hypothetical protein
VDVPVCSVQIFPLVHHASQPQMGWLTVQAWAKRFPLAVMALAQSLPVPALWFRRHAIALLPVQIRWSGKKLFAKLLAQGCLRLNCLVAERPLTAALVSIQHSHYQPILLELQRRLFYNATVVAGFLLALWFRRPVRGPQ